jgi:hypothetical protein
MKRVLGILFAIVFSFLSNPSGAVEISCYDSCMQDNKINCDGLNGDALRECQERIGRRSLVCECYCTKDANGDYPKDGACDHLWDPPVPQTSAIDEIFS